MKTGITQVTTGTDFTRAVQVTPIAAQVGHWYVEFTSQLRSAKNSDEWQRNFAMTLQTEELQRLRDALDVALTKSSEEHVHA